MDAKSACETGVNAPVCDVGEDAGAKFQSIRPTLAAPLRENLLFGQHYRSLLNQHSLVW